MRSLRSVAIWVASFGLSGFVVALIACHIFHPGLSPRDHRISEYANASGGVVMTLGFASWSAGFLALSVALGSDRALRGRHMLAGLLAIAAFGMALVATFHTQTSAGTPPPGTTVTWTGHVHDLGSATTFAALVLAAAVGAILDRGLRRPSVVSPIVLVGVAVGAMALLNIDAPGIRQRLLVVGAVCWSSAAVRITAHRSSARLPAP